MSERVGCPGGAFVGPGSARTSSGCGSGPTGGGVVSGWRRSGPTGVGWKGVLPGVGVFTGAASPTVGVALPGIGVECVSGARSGFGFRNVSVPWPLGSRGGWWAVCPAAGLSGLSGCPVSVSRISSPFQRIDSPGSMNIFLPGHVWFLASSGLRSAGRPSCEISFGVGKLGEPTSKRSRISRPWLIIESRSSSCLSRGDRSCPGESEFSCCRSASALWTALSIWSSSRGRIWSIATCWSANVKPCRAHA